MAKNNDAPKFRRETVYLSDEVHTYLHVISKVRGGEPCKTIDETADSLLRELITSRHPKLVKLYEELTILKREARREYEANEAAMMQATGMIQPISTLDEEGK